MIFYLLLFINFAQCAHYNPTSISMLNNGSNISSYNNNTNTKKDNNNVKDTNVKDTNVKYFVIGILALISAQIVCFFSFFYLTKHLNKTKQISLQQTSLREIEIINENFNAYMSQVLWHLIAGITITLLVAGLTSICINHIYNMKINNDEKIEENNNTEETGNIDTISTSIMVGYFILLIWFYYLCYNPIKPSLLANMLFYFISIINGLALGMLIFISAILVNVIMVIFVIFLGLLISGLWTYYSYTYNLYKKIFLFGPILFSVMSIVSVGLLMGFFFSINMIGLYIFALIVSIIINFYVISQTIALLKIQYVYNSNIYPVWGAFLIYVRILDIIYKLLQLLILMKKKKGEK